MSYLFEQPKSFKEQIINLLSSTGVGNKNNYGVLSELGEEENRVLNSIYNSGSKPTFENGRIVGTDIYDKGLSNIGFTLLTEQSLLKENPIHIIQLTEDLTSDIFKEDFYMIDGRQIKFSWFPSKSLEDRYNLLFSAFKNSDDGAIYACVPIKFDINNYYYDRRILEVSYNGNDIRIRFRGDNEIIPVKAI